MFYIREAVSVEQVYGNLKICLPVKGVHVSLFHMRILACSVACKIPNLLQVICANFPGINQAIFYYFLFF